ncbi:MAG: hypothetical protein NTV86_07950 [Planctomycetota bacterium]|nr:hypothetical protein [Planctomycetota bacterium]
MKKFDALKWIRTVRDAQYEQEKGLTDRQKIAKTKTAALAFRKSREERRAAAKRKGRAS